MHPLYWVEQFMNLIAGAVFFVLAVLQLRAMSPNDGFVRQFMWRLLLLAGVFEFLLGVDPRGFHNIWRPTMAFFFFSHQVSAFCMDALFLAVLATARAAALILRKPAPLWLANFVGVAICVVHLGAFFGYIGIHIVGSVAYSGWMFIAGISLTFLLIVVNVFFAALRQEILASKITETTPGGDEGGGGGGRGRDLENGDVQPVVRSTKVSRSIERLRRFRISSSVLIVVAALMAFVGGVSNLDTKTTAWQQWEGDEFKALGPGFALVKVLALVSFVWFAWLPLNRHKVDQGRHAAWTATDNKHLRHKAGDSQSRPRGISSPKRSRPKHDAIHE